MDTPARYRLTLVQEPKFPHAIVSGVNDADTVARCLDGLRRACIARRCCRVLIEERLEGPRLTTYPVYRVISQASERARACCTRGRLRTRP